MGGDMSDDFSTVRPGDKLWSLRYGEVVVTEKHHYKVQCRVAPNHWVLWWFDGRHYDTDVTPDLYWSKPEIIAPPQPKRMVNKQFVGWVNVYPAGLGYLYDTQEQADFGAGKDRIGPAERIDITREVEE